MSHPQWVAEARPKCPKEAAELDKADRALAQLPKDAPTNDFVDLYELMLAARDQLYDAWIAQEMDA